MSVPEFDVIIVGAGMAGLAAARHLVDEGLSVLILEAADYIGGRIRALPWYGGINLNVGAHWIAGDSPLNPLTALAPSVPSVATQNMGSPQSPGIEPGPRDTSSNSMSDVNMINADGSIMPYDWSPIKLAFERLRDASSSKDMRDMETALSDVGWSPATDADRLALWFFCDFEWGLPPRETPIRHTVPAPYDTHFGGDQRLLATEGGAPDLLKPLLANAMANNIKLGTKVSSVRSVGNQMVVTCASLPVCFASRVVIMTASLGVLASGDIAFDPPLDWTLNDHTCMAQYEVVIAEFGSRFWSNGQKRQHLLYAGPPEALPLRMFILDIGAYYNDRPILEFHLAGADAVLVASRTEDDLVAILHRAFPEISDALFQPVRMHCTRWGSNSLTRGAFSVRPMGMTDEEHANMRRPRMDGKLLFAGDGMHEVHCGYMHAAYLSGVEAACSATDVCARPMDVNASPKGECESPSGE